MNGFWTTLTSTFKIFLNFYTLLRWALSKSSQYLWSKSNEVLLQLLIKEQFLLYETPPTRFINTPSIPSKSINSQNYLRPSRIGSKREVSMLGIHLKKSRGSEAQITPFSVLVQFSWDASATRVI